MPTLCFPWILPLLHVSPTSLDQQGAILCKFDADPNSTPRVGSQLDFGRLKLTVGDNFIPWPIEILFLGQLLNLAWAIYTLEYSLGTLILQVFDFL